MKAVPTLGEKREGRGGREGNGKRRGSNDSGDGDYAVEENGIEKVVRTQGGGEEVASKRCWRELTYLILSLRAGLMIEAMKLAANEPIFSTGK